METEKWAVQKWCDLGDLSQEYNDELRWASSFFIGIQASRVKRTLIQKKIDKVNKKIRQVELILRKIGFNYN